MQREAGAGDERPGPRDRAWPKQEVRALRQALKDVPAAMEKNERFRRVSALVGGRHSKKECYDKYKELKAEAKLKQAVSKQNLASAAGVNSSRRDHNPPKKHTGTTHDTGDVALPLAGEFPQSMAAIGRQDEVKNAYSTAGSVAASAGSGTFSERSSTFSSWSSHSAEFLGQQQRQQQQAQQPQRRSTPSSALSSVPSQLRQNVNGDSSTELGTGAGVSHEVHRHESFNQMGTVARPSHLSGGETTIRGSGSGTCDGADSRPISNSHDESGFHSTAREAASCEEELMKVEDVQVEDFCLEEELLVVDQDCAEGSAQTSRAGRHGGAGRAGRNSQGQCSSAGGNIGHDGDEPPGKVAVTEAEANGARALVFGDPMKRFNEAWREQGFYFSAVAGLRYGLVQAEGGPCGVLAAVQAFLLEDMVFGNRAGCEWRNPKRSQRELSLASALSSIIWRAGDGNTAVLALSEGSASVQRSSRYRPGGVTESIKLYRVGNKSALEGLVLDSLHQFTEKKGAGVILLVYSCIFGRGIEAVGDDMDRGFGEAPTLMANHGYASQELVNLLLLGRAYSNVFDGRRVMGEEDTATRIEGGGGGGGGREVVGSGKAGDKVVLTGVPERGRVGFLTLFEAYKHVEVGNRLKSPVNPIWVVCSESHYSVLFCPDRSTVPSSPIATMVATTAAVEGAGEQAAACKAGGRNPSRTAAHDPANATHFGGADRKHDTYGGGGTGNDTLRLASRGGTGEYEEGVDGTPPWEEKDDKEEFHLEYYDGLGRQDEVIRLTVDRRHGTRDLAPPPTIDDEANGDLVPPLDLVIRTRWPGATVDWNGTDPIL